MLVSAVVAAMTAATTAGRKWMTERDRSAYERARADITAEEAKAALETKNRELTLVNEENAQLRENVERLSRTLDRITGGASQ